jgi:hypothetical protein
VKDAIVAFNTVVNCAGPSIRVGVVESGSTHPANLTIANNIVFGTKGSTSAPIAEDNAPTSKKYEGNLYYGVGSTSLSGWAKSTQSLLALTGGLYRPGPSSPAVDQAKGTYTTLNTYSMSKDFDGGTRSGTWDVGADEYNIQGNVKQPLMPDDAGPCWMQSGGCNPITTSAISGTNPDDIRDAAIYPNPSKGSFVIDITHLFAAKVKIEITDISGKIIISVSDYEGTFIQMPAAEKGIYFVRIYTEEKVITKKIVVM